MTTTISEQRRTYSETAKAALTLARQSGDGWEHHVRHRGIVYVTTRDGIVRLVKSDNGRTISERRIPAL